MKKIIICITMLLFSIVLVGCNKEVIKVTKFEKLSDGTYGVDFDFDYDIIYKNTYYVLKIPNTYQGKPVTKLGSRSINDQYGCIKEVKIPKSITSIDPDAFDLCPGLYKIHVNSKNEVYKAYNYMLYSKDLTELLYCPQARIGDIRVPKELKIIGEQAFYRSNTLKSLKIPSSVIEIKDNAFNNCENLEKITFGQNSKLEKIGYRSFAENEKLEEIVLPNSLLYIGDSAFSQCKKLKTVTFEPLSRLEVIGAGSFNDCSSIEEIIIPKSVKTIQYSAFSDCVLLKNIQFEQGSELQTIGGSAFSSCQSLVSITIPETVTTIGGGTFYRCVKLEEIILPPNLETIENLLFNSCESLKTIQLPNKISLIGWGAFSDCSNLESIVIPNGVKEIQITVFQNCKNLSYVSLPNSITKIGHSIFNGCDKLTSIDYNGTSEQWEKTEKPEFADHLFDLTINFINE